MTAFNVGTIVVEYLCTKAIYERCPALSRKAAPKEEEEAAAAVAEGLRVDRVDRVDGGGKARRPGLADTLHSFRLYFSTPVSLPGLALALLYANNMSYGGVMTAYVAWRGMPPPLIGLTRGISATIGLLGTIAFKYSSSYLSLQDSGMWAIVWQCAMLGVGFASSWIEETDVASRASRASLAMLIGGTALSRIGLWTFDMSVTQMMQEQVPENIRGRVGGVQTALCSFFGAFSYVQGLYWSRPEDFKSVITVSYGAVVGAVVAYSVFYGRSGKSGRRISC